jgi:hypothetical protein
MTTKEVHSADYKLTKAIKLQAGDRILDLHKLEAFEVEKVEQCGTLYRVSCACGAAYKVGRGAYFRVAI